MTADTTTPMDVLTAGAALLVHAPQQEAAVIAEAYADGELGPVEALRHLNTLLRSVDAVLRPLQEARDAIREAMAKPLLASGKLVELANEAVITWVEPTISESYERAKVDQLVADLVTQGGPMTAVAAQIAALKKQSTRAGFVKVERPRAVQLPAAEEPPF